MHMQNTHTHILHAMHRYVHACMSQLSRFFQLWPPSLQRELCRVLFTEEFVRLETVMSRGNSPTKVFFVVSGKVRPTGGGRTHGAGAAGSCAACCCIRSGVFRLETFMTRSNSPTKLLFIVATGFLKMGWSCKLANSTQHKTNNL